MNFEGPQSGPQRSALLWKKPRLWETIAPLWKAGF